MQHFECQACNQPVYFESSQCDACGSRLGYAPEIHDLVTLTDGECGLALLLDQSKRVRLCQNANDVSCNWLVPEASSDSFCLACSHNRIVPDLSMPMNLQRWRQVEQAKRRLFYSLLQLRLPITSRANDEKGLAWDFLADTQAGSASTSVMTGHFDGVITINIAEADDEERERRRIALREPYRTLLGHFRHEVGHYYWIMLVERNPDMTVIGRFREIFGDERSDYVTSLDNHYLYGAPADWQEKWISAYASSHPWEDWAETWAHYLHMVDTLETANAFGVRLRSRTLEANLETAIDFDPHLASLDRLIAGWLPLTFAANSLNRSMGQKDFYPFVLTPVVVSKLAFIHELIRAAAGVGQQSPDDGLRAMAMALRMRVATPPL